jgi:hypothetical protein
MKNPLLKKANGFDNPTGKGKTHYTGFYPEAVGGKWNPMTDNKNLSGEISEQLGGYAPGTRGADKMQEYINGLYRGTQEPPTEPEGKKSGTGKWLNASKTATGEMSRGDVTREAYPAHFAIAEALGGTVEPFDVYQGLYVDTKFGRLFISMEDGGMATVWNEANTNESNAFFYDDENSAVDAALSTIPNPPEVQPYGEWKREEEVNPAKKAPRKTKTAPKDKKIRKTPEFSEEDKISLHGLGVKGSLKTVWDKAITAGVLKFESNRYAFSKEAGEAVRATLKDTVIQVNSSLNHCHIPKSASAHEAAMKAVAHHINEENTKLDKLSRLAKRAAAATHVLYDAGPSSYTVRVMKGNNTIDEYNGGNSPYDSTSEFNRTENDAIEYQRLLEFAETTAKEMAEQYGVPENMVDHDEDLMAEEREEAGMDFTREDIGELHSMGIKEGGSKSASRYFPHDPKIPFSDDAKAPAGTELSPDTFPKDDPKAKARVEEKHKEFKSRMLQGAAKPKCPHCGSTKYALMPTDFETAKCDECGKNWDHGIVDGINNPSEKTAFFSPEEAEKFRADNGGSNVLLNEDAIQSDDRRVGHEPTEDSKWEPVFDKDAAANFDTHWNENCPLPERQRCDTDDAETCCGGGFAYNDKKEWVGVPCQCKDCHPPLMGTDHPHVKFIQDKFEHVSSQKTAAVYKVEQQSSNNWVVVGLPSLGWDNEGVDKTYPNTTIIPGLNHSLRTPEGLTQGIYEQLYDEFQTNDNLKEGDIFDTPVGQFICQGFHVLPHDEKAKAALKAVDDMYKCATCGCDQGDHRREYDPDGSLYFECMNHPDTCKEFKKRGKVAAIAPPAAPPPAFVEPAPAQRPAMQFPLQVKAPEATPGKVKPALTPQPLETFPFSGEVKNPH